MFFTTLMGYFNLDKWAFAHLKQVFPPIIDNSMNKNIITLLLSRKQQQQLCHDMI